MLSSSFWLLPLLAACALASPKTQTKDTADFKEVVELEFSNFDTLVTGSKMPWIIEFTAEGPTDAAKKAAEDAEAIARVGHINTKEEELLKFMELSSDTAPKFRCYPYGDKDTHSDHESVEDAVKAVMASLPENLVTELKQDSDIQSFLLRGFQTGRISVLFFTSKEGIPNLVRRVALWMLDDFNLGVFGNPSEATRKSLGVERVPHLVLMVPEDANDGKGVRFMPAPYDRTKFGGLKFQNILRFLVVAKGELKQMNKWPQAPPQQQEQHQKQSSDKSQQATGTTNFKPEKIFELTADTKDACGENKLGLCVVLLVDGSPQAAADRAARIETLEKVQYSPVHKGRPLHFMWVDGLCHRSFAEAFGVVPESMPSVVAFSPKKKKAALMVGAFEKNTISTFISGVLGGKVGLFDLEEFPQVSSKDDCSQLYQPPAAEEEFDLSDIMGDDMGGDNEGQEEREALEKEAAAARKAAEDAALEAEMEEKRRRAQAEVERLNKRTRKRRSQPKTEL
eukprot:m.78099 g.78099  ORF g.78099 m.78099 type:complete len:510 (+) comp17334_c0_seq3:79-1608(+)